MDINEIELVITQEKEEFKIPCNHADLSPENLNTLIPSTVNQMFKYEKVLRKIDAKKKILYNRQFEIKLIFNGKVLFDTKKPEYDNVRNFFRFNRASESRRKFALYLYCAVFQNLKHPFYEQEFNRLIREKNIEDILTLMKDKEY